MIFTYIYHISNPLTSLILLMVQTEIPNNRLGMDETQVNYGIKKTFPSPGHSMTPWSINSITGFPVVSWYNHWREKNRLTEALPDKKDFINESLGSVVADWQTQRMRHVEISSDPGPWECGVGNMGSFFFFHPEFGFKKTGSVCFFFLGGGGVVIKLDAKMLLALLRDFPDN